MKEAVSKRNRLLLEKKRNSLEQQCDHGRRKLRAKIAGVLLEVRKRQVLHEQQERQRKFREERFARGVGPPPELGDSTQEALGLSLFEESSDDVPMPAESKVALLRRTALLDSLSLHELDMMRKAPEWFFSGPAITLAAPPEPKSPSHSLSAAGSLSNSSSAPQISEQKNSS